MTGLRHKQWSALRQGTDTYAPIFTSAGWLHYPNPLVHARMHMRCAHAWLLPIIFITFRTGISKHVRPTVTVVFSTELRTHERIVAQQHRRELRSRTAPLATSGKALAMSDTALTTSERALASDLSRFARAVHTARVCCASVPACVRGLLHVSMRPRWPACVRVCLRMCVWASACDAQPRCTHERAHIRAEVHKCTSTETP